MPHEREMSRDRDMVLKHQHSFSGESISSRSSLTIPMWDSSDPERAPPPLPLNPGVGSPVSKPGTSANVAAAAEAIAIRVRESQFITSTSPTRSPEKSLIKGHHHKRLQSINNGSVKDLSSHLENGRPDRSPERLTARPRSALSEDQPDVRTPTRPESRSETPTPMSRDLGRDIPPLRPSSRPPLKAILGEDPPQSATMRALQGKGSEDRDITPTQSKRDSMALVRTPHSIDAISSQILSLTTIATNLQQEMAQLSRRSRDNATDLVSLKDATNQRDEDIRKTLRELVVNLKEEGPRTLPRPNSSLFIEERPHYSPATPKNISLPRIPSPASFAASLDREMVASPNPFPTDGAAAIALLEKVLREMGTKEGQEHISRAIAEFASKGNATTFSPDISRKLEDIIRMLKADAQSKALVRAGPSTGSAESKEPEAAYDYSLHPAVALARAGRNMSMGNVPAMPASRDVQNPAASAVINEDMSKLIKRIKDSVAESGGLTNEVKALVRELRGEVLGMGREIGRQLDAVEKNSAKQASNGTGREDVLRIVEDGLSQLKKHMDETLREHRRQSAASLTAKSVVDAQEISNTIQTALRELQLDQLQNKSQNFEREDILEAVREAWEAYKPEIEVKNDGLAPDEILECLEKGLKDYRSKLPEDSKGATYEDVLDAVKQGLEGFQPPKIDTELTLTRDEIISTMRECMESFDSSSKSSGIDLEKQDIMDAVKEALLLHAAALSRDSTVSREDLLDAVRDGFINHEPMAKELEISRDDLFDAVKSAMAEMPSTATDGQTLAKMRELFDGIRDEIQQRSTRSGGDTGEVLDAMKDSLEVLRSNIETYVDRAADVTGKDEIIETVKDGMENLKADLEASIANIRPAAPTSSAELLDVMEKEFEHLRSSLTSSLGRAEGPAGGREELLDALREGFDELKASKTVNSGSSNVGEELRYLRETIASTMTRAGGSIDREEILEAIRDGIDRMQLNNKAGRPESILSSTSELLDAFHDGVDKLKTDIEQMVTKDSIEGLRSDVERIAKEVNRPADMAVNHEILDLLKEGLAAVQLDIAKLVAQQDTISNKGREVIIAEEEDASKSLSRPDIQNLEVMITQLQMKVDSLDNQVPPIDPSVIKPEFENLEGMVKDLQDKVETFTTKGESKTEPATKDDIEAIETILMNSKAKLDELSMPDAADLAKAAQLASLETIMKDLSSAMDDLTIRQEDNLASKTEFASLESMVKALQEGFQDLQIKLEDGGTKRSDLEALEVLCLETSTQLKEFIPEGEKAATSSALAGIQTLLKEFHEQTQVFQEKMHLDSEMTAQAFEARKIEHGGLADKIEDVKSFLENIRMELKSKIESGGQGIESLASTLTTMGEALTAADATESLDEMKELLASKLVEMSEAQTTGLEAHRELFAEKQDEHKTAMLDEVNAKLDTAFGELLLKFEEAQKTAAEKSASLEEKTSDGVDAMLSTKAIADDLKALVDTLGLTVTESCNNMAEDSKTVFSKVDELTAKQEVGFSSLASELKEDQQLTRTDLARTTMTIENLSGMLGEHNPKVMTAIQDILNTMSQHFEMAQKSTEEIKSTVKEIPGSIPLPALPAPATTPIEARSVLTEKYDDAEVHAKLDKLVELSAETGKSAMDIELLEEIKNQVTATAADFNAFMQTQRALISDREASHQKEQEEAGVALEKRVAQKQAVEADIVRLTDDKNGLQSSVAELKETADMLKQEEKEMLNLKAKLRAELSSLETALQIRKEEMYIMESRAEKLEKRIMESLVDQSRSLRAAPKKPAPNLDAMNLKRVNSAASRTTIATSASTARSSRAGTLSKPTTPAATALGKALKQRQPPSTTASPAGSLRADRRILSLSTISGNKGTTREDLGAVNSAKASSGLGSLKRSHSVKTIPTRNTSWSGTKQMGKQLEKENTVLEEVDESSDAGTERRSSYYADTDLGNESFVTEGVTDSAVSSARPSYAPSSVAGTMDDSDREGDDEETTARNQLQVYTGLRELDLADADKHMVLYGKDSGIGSEPATATLETNGNFFDGGDSTRN